MHWNTVETRNDEIEQKWKQIQQSFPDKTHEWRRVEGSAPAEEAQRRDGQVPETVVHAVRGPAAEVRVLARTPRPLLPPGDPLARHGP